MSIEYEELRERRAKRERAKKKRKLIIWIVLLAVVITVITALIAHFTTNVYQDKEEFINYATEQFKDDDVIKITGTREKTFEYASPISYAVENDRIDNKVVEAFRQEKVKLLVNDYTAIKTAEENERAAKNKNDKHYKPLENALIINSMTSNSGNGVISIAIESSDNQEKEKDMVRLSTSIDTYLISEKTGAPMIPEQVFDPDYRRVCSDYFTKYFEEKFNSKDLTENWKDYVSNKYANFNTFVVGENTVTFFFDEGTVLNKEKGVIAAKMTKNEMGDAIRSSVVVRYIDPSKPMVALTYDDGPGGASETRILDCLEKNGAVATFFYSGNRIKNNPGQIKRAQILGCELGNHTWSHPQLTKLSLEAAKSEITRTSEAIKSVCGAYPTVFRPSYGDTNESVNSIAGLPVIMWSVDTLDWKTRSAQKTLDSVKNAAASSRLDGRIVLMHSIHEPTAEATENIVPWLHANGYQTVTVSELIKYKKGETPVSGKVYR